MRRTSTSISTFTDNTGRVIKADVEVTQEGTGIHRTFTVERGGVFRPEPLNPRKKGHWGRVATVLGFRSIDSGLYVILRFADDGSKGYALAVCRRERSDGVHDQGPLSRWGVPPLGTRSASGHAFRLWARVPPLGTRSASGHA